MENAFYFRTIMPSFKILIYFSFGPCLVQLTIDSKSYFHGFFVKTKIWISGFVADNTSGTPDLKWLILDVLYTFNTPEHCYG